MTGGPSGPTGENTFSNSSLKSRSKERYTVPQNSPSSSKVNRNEENYKRNNGEKKSLKPKQCTHHIHANPLQDQSEENKRHQPEKRNLSKTPTITEFSMFYEQQQLVERKTQSFKEKNSATVIFKSDSKAVCNSDVVKHDIENNTNDQPNTFKVTPNLSIINMKTSKPEDDNPPYQVAGKVLNVQKMPSVNIRPGFTIQHGPKVNIVGSSSSSYKPKRKNTEFFDVVYPHSTSVINESFVSEQGGHSRPTENYIEYVCERHTFPSGRLIPGTSGENLRHSYQQDTLNLEEKKEVLIDLIRLVTEKIEKQSSTKKKNCCRIIFSLPLLASVVRKIQVDCVKCTDQLANHLDRLIVLMREEYRGYKVFTDDHCCQLDETVRYQIVELELMQEENFKRKTAGNVTVVKHKEEAARLKSPKKTVSFESIPDEVAELTIAENRKRIEKTNTLQTPRKKGVLSVSQKKPTLFGLQQTSGSKNMKHENKNIGNKRIVVAGPSTDRTTDSAKRSNPVLNKKADVSSSVKETTVVGQVLKNLSHKKSILKHNPVSNASSANKSRKDLNALVTIIDQKDTTSEFDKWIENRSCKIQQIHDELNKMVGSSMEKYLGNGPSRNESDQSTSVLKLLASSNIHVNDENDSEDMNNKRTNTEQRENKQTDQDVPDLSMQDAAPEYDEDFEEDVEELPDINSSDSLQETAADAENDSVVSLANEAANTTIGGNASLAPPEVSNMKENPTIKVCTENEDEKEKPIKVNIATSPINFKTSPQSVDVSVNTSIPPFEIRKVTIATSPINLAVSNVRSTMVQTDSLGNEETRVASPNQNNTGEADLTVPFLRLNPTPIENIFKVSLGETYEKSLSLHANSSNQSLKLIVQLPASGKEKEGSKIIELSDESGRETCPRNGNAEGGKQSNAKVSKNLKIDASVPEEIKFCDTSSNNRLSKQTIKDIVEPTVSEVLEKISKDKILYTAPFCNEEKGVVPNSDTSSGLVKPNIILQTKHGLWKKCDDNPILSVIDVEQSNPKVDSCNQTEVEKQNAYVQVADSVAGSSHERATSAQRFDLVSSRSRSYLEMVLPPPPTTRTQLSTPSCSSSWQVSSRSSSATSTFSVKNDERLQPLEKLSDGELLLEACNCKIGEICELCVPKLDLSFGELKTKKRNKRIVSCSSSENSHRHTSVSLSNLPLHLEPRPTSVRINPSSAPNLTIKSNLDGATVKTALGSFNQHIKNREIAAKTERKSNLKQFSEIAKSVLSDLGRDLKTFSGTDELKYAFPKPFIPLSTVNQQATVSDHMSTSSSDSLKSSKSHTGLGSKKSSSKHGTKSRGSLVIKTPVGTPKIDVVIEDPELSTSSYQTSVTSVSVDQLPDALSSHSSADASS